ncbi:PEP-CTERM sorting domain-containing protein [Coraliomargarita parva]|uniref:PEP-CTERM sorting domain-containing protein n=1 Tax=Coraliomargarita parva TaxID=3014050 RepID=UPI0022B370BC|nr:PEP-CTERM sorting domain-containing protein [Coraliomargarita parva]
MMKTTHKILLSALVLAPALLGAETILIDFGDNSYTTTGNWNNLAVTPTTDEADLSATGVSLINTAGTSSGITLDITNAFDGRNINGTTSTTLYGDSNPGRDSFYTSASTGDNMAVLTFTGLDPDKTYDFTMFASRWSASYRDTDYILDGLNSSTVTLDASDWDGVTTAYDSTNVSNTVTASAISPTAGGVITLTVTPGTRNTSGYSYLGVVEIAVIPEPGSVALLLGAMATGFVMLRRRR